MARVPATGVFPTDTLVSVALEPYVAAHSGSWADALPFVAMTLLDSAIPAAAGGGPARGRLPADGPRLADDQIRDAKELVLAFFVVVVASDLG